MQNFSSWYSVIERNGLRWIAVIYVIKKYQKGKDMSAKYKDVSL